MRLFIGIELPDDARAILAERARALQAALRAAGGGTKIRWVEGTNLHVTIAFLGQVAVDRADALRAAFERPFGYVPFEARLGGLGAFPESGPARVIWAGFDAGGSGMTSLHEHIYRRLRPLGFEPDDRAYSPHITLGRVKEIDGRGTRAVRQALAAAPPLGATFRVEVATLFNSRTQPSGARYEPLLRVPLT